MEHQEEFVEKVDNNTYKCPECGAPMQYDPESSSLKCDYCNQIINLEKVFSDREIDFYSESNDDLSWQKENQLIRCASCGNENVISKKEMSTVCPFCGSKQVISYDEIPGIKPNRVIPFKLSSDDAITVYRKKIKKKFFAPRKVKKMYLDLVVNGVYIPSWTYDSDTFSTYTGRLGKRYTVTVGSGKNKRTVTKIRWYDISGTNLSSFDDVLINSGKSISQEDLNKISPFNTNDSIVFEEGYLAGFKAEHYTKDVKSGFDSAQYIMEQRIRYAILSRYNYDVIGDLNIDTRYSRVSYKYVLLPVWFGILDYNNKKYRFIVNGETGKLKAKYPKSILKILLTVFGIIAIVALLLLLVNIYG
jgi:DNA-directed RNA polymerase subunit RPC12/RpoP